MSLRLLVPFLLICLIAFAGSFFLAKRRVYWAYTLGIVFALIPFSAINYFAVWWYRGMTDPDTPFFEALVEVWTDDDAMFLLIIGALQLAVSTGLFFAGKSMGRGRIAADGMDEGGE